MGKGTNTLPSAGQNCDPASSAASAVLTSNREPSAPGKGGLFEADKEAKLRWLASFPELDSNPITEVDLETGTVVYKNPAASQLLPDLGSNDLGHPWTEGLHQIAERLKTNQCTSVRREVQIGESFFDQSVTSPGGARLRVCGVDVTKRVHLQRQVEAASAEALEARNCLAAVMEMLPVGVALADSAGHCIKSNAMFHRIWGRPVPDSPSSSSQTANLIELEQWSELREFTVGAAASNAVVQIHKSDGSPAFVLNNWAPVLGPDKQVIGCAIAIMDVTERIEAENALRRSREDLNHAQAVARTGSWRLELQENRLLWSDEAYRIFGLPKGTPLTYQTFLEVVHPEDRAYVDSQWQAALKGAPYDCEHRLAGDGPVRWVRERAVLEFGPDGSLVSGLGTTQDITEKKEAERALRQAKEEWERTFDAVPDLIAIIDNQHRIKRVNRAMAQRLALSPDECVGKKCHELVHGSVCPPGFCPHSRTMVDGRECAVEIQEPRIDGDFLVSTTALTDVSGRPIASVHVARDITARKRAERMLAESEQRYRGLINLSPDAILVTRDDRVTFVNPAGVKLFGLANEEELLGRNLFDFLLEEDRGRFAKAIWQMHEGAFQTIPSLICNIVGLDRQTREAEVSAVPVQFDGANAIQLVFRDITQRNRDQRSLRESQQRLAQAMLLGRCFAFEWNPQTDEVIRSSECQSILGLGDHEATQDTGRQYFRRVHSEDCEAFIAAVQNLKPGAETYRTRYRVTRPDGDVVTLEEMGRASFSQDGRFVRLIGITFDVTERERNQAALRQNEQRYALAQRAGNIASWEWDLQSDRILWSEQTKGLLGYEPGEFGRTLQAFLDRVHPDDRSRVEQALRSAAREGSAYDVEHRLILQDGSIRWISGIAEIHADEPAKSPRMVGIIADITRRKLAEQARTDYLARVNALVQVSREILDQDSLKGLLKLAAIAAEQLTQAREVLCATDYKRTTFSIAAQRRGALDMPEAIGHVVALPPGDMYLDWLGSHDTVRSSLEALPALPRWWSPTDHPIRGGLLGARLTARDGSASGFLLLSDKVGGFTTEDEALLAQLAALVSVGQQRLEARQEALRRANELHAVFSSMAEMVIIYDSRGVPASANPATTRLFGFDPVGSSIEAFVSRLNIRHLNGRRIRPDEMPSQRVLNGGAVRNIRMALTGAAGTNYIVVASAAQLTDGQQSIGAVCVWHDVTEREHLVNELELRVQERTAGLRETVRCLEEEIKERQRAEAALAESEERYRTLFQHAPVGIVMTDYRGNVYAANQATRSLLGWSREDFRGLKAHRLYADASDRARLIDSLRQTGRAENLDIELKRVDGSRIDAALQMNRLELRGEEMIMTLVQDLTQQKQAQKRDQGVRKLLELFASQSSRQDYLEAVVKLLRDWCDCHCAGIRLQDGSGCMPFVARIGFPLGFVRSEEQLCLGNQGCACLRALRAEPFASERQYATPHGSFICNKMSRWLKRLGRDGKGAKGLPCAEAKFESVAHVPIRFHSQMQGAIHLADRRGDRFPASVASFIEAISPVIGEALHRFSVEAELRDREQRLRSMFEHHEAIMLLIEASTGEIKDINSAASRFYGFSKERLRGMKFDELNAFPATRSSREQERPVREHQPVFVLAHRLASGEIRIVEVHSSPVQVGAEQAHFCIIHDITERKRLEQRVLEVGDKERQSIGRDLHDSLGGHLTGIALITKGLAQALREKKLPESTIAEELVEAVNQAVSQSRSIARGVCPVGLGRFGLATGLQEYAVNASKLFRVPVRFRTRGAVTVPDEQVATHLYRIAQEAAANAVRHGHPKKILIQLESREHGVVLSVKDDGVGFSGPPVAGRGMGMQTMRYRADLIGARLTVTSAPGKGTLVLCLLPRQ